MADPAPLSFKTPGGGGGGGLGGVAYKDRARPPPPGQPGNEIPMLMKLIQIKTIAPFVQTTPN